MTFPTITISSSSHLIRTSQSLESLFNENGVVRTGHELRQSQSSPSISSLERTSLSNAFQEAQTLFNRLSISPDRRLAHRSYSLRATRSIEDVGQVLQKADTAEGEAQLKREISEVRKKFQASHEGLAEEIQAATGPSQASSAHFHEIFPYLFLGNAMAAYSIVRNNIPSNVQTVVSLIKLDEGMTKNVPAKLQEKGIQHLVLPVGGTDWQEFVNVVSMRPDAYQTAEPSTWFEAVFTIIAQRLMQKQNVLVHCHAGASRSAALVVAFIIRYFGVDAEQAQLFVASKRPVVSINDNLMRGLKDYSTVRLPWI